MQTYFCPKCWQEARETWSRCPICSYDLAAHSSQLVSMEAARLLERTRGA